MREIGSTTCKKRLNYDQDGDIMMIMMIMIKTMTL